MKFTSVFLVAFLARANGYVAGSSGRSFVTTRHAETSLTSMQMTADENPTPSTFREAEVLGLRLMQEGNFEKALDGKY